MKITICKKWCGLFTALLILTLAAVVAAQTYKQGNSVETQDGRIGVIESFKNNEMAKVKFGDGSSQYFMLTSLKLIQPPKPALSGPSEVFRPGDLVVNSAGQQLRIDSIEGDTATVRYGVGKYNVYKEKLSQLMSVKTAAANREQENTGKLVRAQFEDEAQPFRDVIRNFAKFVDAKYAEHETSDDPLWIAKQQKGLDGLAAVCQKFPNVIDAPGMDRPGYADSILSHPADWCRIAEQRTALIGKMKLSYNAMRVTSIVTTWGNAINSAISDTDGNVSEGLQMLLYERAAWEAKEFKKEKKNYDEAGVAIPRELMASLDEKIVELKARIDREAPTRSWVVPGQKDPGSEALATRGFPGAKVLRSGMIYTTWKSANDTSLIGTASNGAKLYRTTIGFYRYKLGNALVKIPGRPYCQDRAFSVGQPKKGGGFGATEFTGFRDYGIFVKCP